MKRTIILAALLYSTAAWAQPAEVPDPTITPGEIATTDINDICSRKGGTYSQRHRLSQTPAIKREVLSRYGVAWGERGRFEDDHDVPLCAGGSDAVENRWPQPRSGSDWVAGDKDKLEAETCRQICSREITVHEGQAWFLAPADWRKSFCAVFTDDDRCGR